MISAHTHSTLYEGFMFYEQFPQMQLHLYESLLRVFLHIYGFCVCKRETESE